jgi:hypothetical protein
MFPKLSACLSVSSELLLWLTVRAADVPLRGKVLVLQESCDSSLHAALLTAPSCAVEVSASTLSTVPATAMFDSILLVEPDGDLRLEVSKQSLFSKLNKGGSLSVVTRRGFQPANSKEDGWEITATPLMLTTEELLLLSIREWLDEKKSGALKKFVLSLIALPLAALLTIRLRKERAKTRPSGWFVERWWHRPE